MNKKEKINSKFKAFRACLSVLNAESSEDILELVDKNSTFTNIQSLKKIMLDKDFIEENVNWSPLIEFEFDRLLVDLLSHFSETIDNLELDGFSKNPKIINDRRIFILNDLIQIVYTLSEVFFKNDTLYKFVANLLRKEVIEVLLSYFKEEIFQKVFTNGSDFHFLLISIVRIIRNFSEDANYIILFSKRKETNLSGKVLFQIQLETILEKFSSVCKHNGYDKELNEISFNLKQKSLEKCVEFLKEMETEPLKIFESDDAYNDFLYIFRCVQMQSFKDYDLFSNNQFYNLITKVFGYIYSIKNDMVIDETIVIQNKYPPLTLDSNEKVVSIFYYLLTITNYIKIDSSISVKQIIFYYIKFLDEDILIKKLKKIAPDVALEILFLLQKMSIYADTSKKDWNSVIRVLIKFLNKGENSNEENFISLWIICFTY